MGFFDGIVNGAKQFGKDFIGVTGQIYHMTMDTGKAALDGVYTALTDPGKFINDVGRNSAAYAEHISDSWEKGTATIAKGWSEMEDGRGLWNALGSTVNGVSQIASFGVSDVWDDHVESVMETHRDELGNVYGYSAKEGTDYITQRWIESGAERRALVQNSEEEIAEAIAEGDRDRVSELDDKLFQATVGKDLQKAATVVGTTALVVGGVAAAIPTGGTSLAVSGAAVSGITAATVAHTAGSVALASSVVGLGGTAMANNDIDLEAMNVSDDIADVISDQVDALKAAGRLSDDQVDRYTDVMSTYYRATLYNSADPNFAANNGFSSNEELRDWLLVNNGLPTMSESRDMPGSDLADAYDSYYADMAEACGLGPEHAAVLSHIGSEYAAGNITEEQYTREACRVQCEMFDITDEQKDRYAEYSTMLSMGAMTDEQFTEAVTTDPAFADYMTEEGLSFPLTETSLERMVSAQEQLAATQQAVQAQQPEPGQDLVAEQAAPDAYAPYM